MLTGQVQKSKCTLILTEGDSAKSTAMVSGLEIVGRDKYGVFPLKGKLLNVRDEKNIKKLLENDEINNIKKIRGLQTGTVYESASQ